MAKVAIRMMMSRNLSSDRVLTLSSAMRRLPVGAGPVTDLGMAVEDRVMRRRTVSGSVGACGTGIRSITWKCVGLSCGVDSG